MILPGGGACSAAPCESFADGSEKTVSATCRLRAREGSAQADRLTGQGWSGKNEHPSVSRAAGEKGCRGGEARTN